MPVTIDQQIASVRRELAMRKNAYPKWVANGRMKQEAADKELAAMQAVHDSLTGLLAQLPVGEAMDTRFSPTSRDLVALRADAAATGRDGLPVKVNVAPACLYMVWPNSQHDPSDAESNPYRCISFHLPKPE